MSLIEKGRRLCTCSYNSFILLFRFGKPRKFYIRGNNSKVDAMETGCISISYLLPASDQGD